MAKLPKIVIAVEGGCVVEVYGTEDTDVVVYDFDDLDKKPEEIEDLRVEYETLVARMFQLV